MLESSLTSFAAVFTICLTLIGGVWRLTNQLDRQFREVRGLIYEKIEQTLAKLEYHESHDDKRFQAISNDLWMLRLRMASKDGLTTEDVEKASIKP